MAEIRQGDIWWANLAAPAGRRPVLVLTRSQAIARLGSVTVAPVTRTIRYIESEVVLSADDGVPTECAISLDNIVTVRKGVLTRRITRLGRDHLDAAFAAIRFAFAMPD